MNFKSKQLHPNRKTQRRDVILIMRVRMNDIKTKALNLNTFWVLTCHRHFLVHVKRASKVYTISECEIIVKIDESKLGRLKYHQGHHVNGQWIFGGYGVGSGKCFLIPVPNRTESTLIYLVKDYILLGKKMRSACWAAYRFSENKGYIHESLNHSLYFKDFYNFIFDRF